MIEKLDIEIKNGIYITLTASLFYKDNILYLNNKKYQVTDEFKENLVRIIRTWESGYKDTGIIDEEEYIITVKTDSGEEIIKGRGEYPSNYHELFNLLGGLENEWRIAKRIGF